MAELAIPLIALGSMYLISNQDKKKELLTNMTNNPNTLPNIPHIPSNYPVLQPVSEANVEKYPNPNQTTDKFFNPKNKKYTWINICAIPQFIDGNKKPYQVYSTFEDITNKKINEDIIANSEEQYRFLFSAIQSGIALHEMIYDENNKPIDYKFLKVNPLFEKLTGIKANKAIGNTAKKLLPNIEQFWIDRYAQVVETGKTIEFEEYTISLNKTYKVRAFKVFNNQFAVAFDEIKKEKKTKK